MLEAKDVNFAYLRGQPVINDMECRIEDGEFVALLGHNGSGKTTLSRLFMALCHPRSGQILVDGEDIVKCEPADLADKIGYVFQNPDLQILEDTVFDEVAYGPRAKKLTEETIKRQTMEALDAMGLTDGRGIPSPFELWAKASFGRGCCLSFKSAHLDFGRNYQWSGCLGKRGHDGIFKGHQRKARHYRCAYFP